MIQKYQIENHIELLKSFLPELMVEYERAYYLYIELFPEAQMNASKVIYEERQ
jgi:coenzyme F420-reducing hydrogenase delta subunit